jgi:hypothetical protein
MVRLELSLGSRNRSGWRTGVDIFKKLLASTKNFSSCPLIEYEHYDRETIQPPSTSYNLIISSLALRARPEVFARIFKSLAPGGTFAFSLEHSM